MTKPRTVGPGDNSLRSDDPLVIRGAQTLARLVTQAVRTYEDWKEVAIGLEQGRRHCLSLVPTSNVKSKTYQTAMIQWMRVNGYGEHSKQNQRALRSRLHELYYGENAEAIRVWYEGLPPNEKLRYNYPQTILARFKSTMQGGESGAKRLGYKEAVAKLQEENDDLRAKNKRLERDDTRGPLVTTTSTAQEIARGIYDWLPNGKRQPVAAELMRLLKSTEPRGATPQKRERRRKTAPPQETATIKVEDVPAPQETATIKVEPVEPKSDSEADCEALVAKLRKLREENNRPWVGPDWCSKHKISDEVIDMLLDRGVLRVHPDYPDKGIVGLKDE